MKAIGWELGEQQAFVDKEKAWVRPRRGRNCGKDSERTIELWEELSHEPVSVPVPSCGAFLIGNLRLEGTGELMSGFAQRWGWGPQDPPEGLCHGCQGPDEFMTLFWESSSVGATLRKP